MRISEVGASTHTLSSTDWNQWERAHHVAVDTYNWQINSSFTIRSHLSPPNVYPQSDISQTRRSRPPFPQLTVQQSTYLSDWIGMKMIDGRAWQHEHILSSERNG